MSVDLRINLGIESKDYSKHTGTAIFSARFANLSLIVKFRMNPAEEILIGGSEEREEDNDDFEIPCLPRGLNLHLRLLSNWGDSSRIGLHAIEVFLEDGSRATFQSIESSGEAVEGDEKKLAVTSVAHSSPTLPSSQWATLFHSSPFSLHFQLTHSSLAIALMRIWNYAGSRVHSQRGVRELEMELDGQIIFRGIISPAVTRPLPFSASLRNPGETILFTTSERILEAVAANDECLQFTVESRPTSRSQHSSHVHITPKRPITAEESIEKERRREDRPDESTEKERRREDRPDNHTAALSSCAPSVKVIHFELTANWGMAGKVGLTGLEFFDGEGETIDREGVLISSSDGSTAVQKLLSGDKVTCSPEEMWLTPLDPRAPPTLAVTFPEPTRIAGISIWNYNGGEEMSYAGVRCVSIHINGKLFLRDILLRKAPGFVFFDFVQDIPLIGWPNSASSLPPSLTRPGCISAFIYQIRLLSTWGDQFYIGLNGIELYDEEEKRMKMKPHNLAAFPESLNILPQVSDDPRRSENLINGINDSDRAEESWLTPLLPNLPTRIFFIFDIPTVVSRMLIYNYRKTLDRGARHITISADDVIIWSGQVPRSTAEHAGVIDIPLGDQE